MLTEIFNLLQPGKASHSADDAKKAGDAKKAAPRGTRRADSLKSVSRVARHTDGAVAPDRVFRETANPSFRSLDRQRRWELVNALAHQEQGSMQH